MHKGYFKSDNMIRNWGQSRDFSFSLPDQYYILYILLNFKSQNISFIHFIWTTTDLQLCSDTLIQKRIEVGVSDRDLCRPTPHDKWLGLWCKKKNVLGTSWFNFFNFFNSPAMILSGWMQTFWLGVYVEANPGGLVYVAEPQPPTLHFHFSFGALPQTVGLKSIFTISDGWKNSVKMPVQAGTGKKEKKKNNFSKHSWPITFTVLFY